MIDIKKYRKYLSPVVLLAANIVPIIGVLMWSWDVFIILLLYCAETFIIGIYNFFKLILARKSHWIFNLFMAIFFLFHFNLFVLVQTVFVVVFSQMNISEMTDEQTDEGADFGQMIDRTENYVFDKYLQEGLIALVLSHGFSFFVNYLFGGEYKRVEAGKLMLAPYGRIVVQQLTVILGGFAILIFASSANALLILLIVLKTALDIRAHTKQHTSQPELL